MAFGQFPGNQSVGPAPIVPTPTANQNTTPKVPLAKTQSKLVDTAAIGDGFRKMGNNIIQEQLPGFIHRLLYSIVDALLPGSAPIPYIGRSNYSGYSGYSGGITGGRLSQMPPYNQRAGLGYPAGMDQPMASRRAFDKFLFANREIAMETFQTLLNEAGIMGYLTVSQVYDCIGVPCSMMGAKYYWTAEELKTAEITETPTGECKVIMPKAHIIL